MSAPRWNLAGSSLASPGLAARSAPPRWGRGMGEEGKRAEGGWGASQAEAPPPGAPGQGVFSSSLEERVPYLRHPPRGRRAGRAGRAGRSGGGDAPASGRSRSGRRCGRPRGSPPSAPHPRPSEGPGPRDCAEALGPRLVCAGKRGAARGSPSLGQGGCGKRSSGTTRGCARPRLSRGNPRNRPRIERNGGLLGGRGDVPGRRGRGVARVHSALPARRSADPNPNRFQPTRAQNSLHPQKSRRQHGLRGRRPRAGAAPGCGAEAGRGPPAAPGGTFRPLAPGTGGAGARAGGRRGGGGGGEGAEGAAAALPQQAAGVPGARHPGGGVGPGQPGRHDHGRAGRDFRLPRPGEAGRVQTSPPPGRRPLARRGGGECGGGGPPRAANDPRPAR